MDKFYRIGEKLGFEDYVADALLFCIRVFGDNPEDIPEKVFTRVLFKKHYYRRESKSDVDRRFSFYDPTDFELGRIVDKVGDYHKDKAKADNYIIIRILCEQAKVKSEHVELLLKYHSYDSPKAFYKENNVKPARIKYVKNVIHKALKDKYNDYIELIECID